jgi:tRNA-specific adenosine deaminase 2
VYFGAVNDKFGGTGGVLNIHQGNGKNAPEDDEEVDVYRRNSKEGDYEVSGGWLREEAIVILRRFYVQENGRGEFAILFLCYFVGWNTSEEFYYTDG